MGKRGKTGTVQVQYNAKPISQAIHRYFFSALKAIKPHEMPHRQFRTSALPIAILATLCHASPVTDSPIAGSTAADVFPPASSM